MLPGQLPCSPVARSASTLTGGLVFSWTKQPSNLALDWLGSLLEAKRRRFGLATRSSTILPGTRARRDYGRTCRTLLNQVISLGLLAARLAIRWDAVQVGRHLDLGGVRRRSCSLLQ